MSPGDELQGAGRGASRGERHRSAEPWQSTVIAKGKTQPHKSLRLPRLWEEGHCGGTAL